MENNMSKHFINNVEIKSFKCFENFKIEKLKRVNLIGGKNNVGKTSFMEAICINVYAKNIDSAYTTLMYTTYTREKLAYINREICLKDDISFFENIKYCNVVSNINSFEYKFNKQQGKQEYIFNIYDKNKTFNSREFSYKRILNPSVIFIDNYGFTPKQFSKIYDNAHKINKNIDLNKIINKFDNSIEEIKLSAEEYIECKVRNIEKYIKLTEFGDGFKQFISIIISLYACKNSYLFIDEVESGIHYEKFDEMWEIILSISNENNVQVFATSHSKECIESYMKATISMENICFVELGRNKKDELDSIVMNSESLEQNIKLGNEIRGW